MTLKSLEKPCIPLAFACLNYGRIVIIIVLLAKQNHGESPINII